MNVYWSQPERSSTERGFPGMSGLKTKKQVEFDRHWQECYRLCERDHLSPDGKTLAASSAGRSVSLSSRSISRNASTGE